MNTLVASLFHGPDHSLTAPAALVRRKAGGGIRLRRAAPALALSAVLLALTAGAGTLNVVSVSWPQVNCLFSPTCVVTNYKDRAEIFHWGYNTGDGYLRSRVWRGLPGTAAAGLYAYIYRVDLTGMAPQSGGVHCVARISVPAPASAVTMDLNQDGVTNEHVFVITSGGVGTVAPYAASSSLGKIWFDLGDTHLSTGVCPGQSSYLFGFVSATPPAQAKADLEFLWIEPTISVAVYAPGVMSFGFSTQPIGGVELVLSSNILAILASQAASGSGFEMDLGDSQGWRNAFTQMQPSGSGQYAISMIGHGTMGSRNQAFTGTASLSVSNGLLFTTADFSGAGVSSLLLEYRGPDGGLVGYGEVPNGTTSCGLPLCTNGTTTIPTVCSNAFVSINGEPAACWTFCSDLCAQDSSCSMVQLHQPIRSICVLGRNPALGLVQVITNIHVLLSGLDSVNSVSQQLCASNVWHTAEADGTLRATPGRVVLTPPNAGDQGELNTGNYAANVADVFLPVMSSIWSNLLPSIEVTVDFLGETTAGPQRLAKVSFGGISGALELTADFSPLGSSSYDVVVFLGGTETGRFLRAGTISFSEGPMRMSFARPGFTTWFPPSPIVPPSPVYPPSPIIPLGWGKEVLFHAGGQDLSGDTLLLVPSAPSLQVLNAGSITLSTRGAAELVVGGFHALPAVQGKLQNVKFGDGSVRWRSDTLPGASYFLETTRDLGGSPSWSTLESFLGNGFSRSFTEPASGAMGFFRLRAQ